MSRLNIEQRVAQTSQTKKSGVVVAQNLSDEELQRRDYENNIKQHLTESELKLIDEYQQILSSRFQFQEFATYKLLRRLDFNPTQVEIMVNDMIQKSKSVSEGDWTVTRSKSKSSKKAEINSKEDRKTSNRHDDRDDDDTDDRNEKGQKSFRRNDRDKYQNNKDRYNTYDRDDYRDDDYRRNNRSQRNYNNYDNDYNSRNNYRDNRDTRDTRDNRDYRDNKYNNDRDDDRYQKKTNRSGGDQIKYVPKGKETEQTEQTDQHNDRQAQQQRRGRNEEKVQVIYKPKEKPTETQDHTQTDSKPEQTTQETSHQHTHNHQHTHQHTTHQTTQQPTHQTTHQSTHQTTQPTPKPEEKPKEQPKPDTTKTQKQTQPAPELVNKHFGEHNIHEFFTNSTEKQKLPPSEETDYIDTVLNHTKDHKREEARLHTPIDHDRTSQTANKPSLDHHSTSNSHGGHIQQNFTQQQNTTQQQHTTNTSIFTHPFGFMPYVVFPQPIGQIIIPLSSLHACNPDALTYKGDVKTQQNYQFGHDSTNIQQEDKKGKHAHFSTKSDEFFSFGTNDEFLKKQNTQQQQNSSHYSQFPGYGQNNKQWN